MTIKKEYLKYALKGGIAALLALVAAYLLHVQQSYWVLFGATTVTKLYMGASVQRGKQRVYGTFLGVVISLLLALVLLHWPVGVIIIIPFCVFGAVYYFQYYSVAVIFITILFVLTFGVISHHPVSYGIARVLDTALGVALATIVSLYIWPNRISHVLEREFHNYFSHATLLFEKFSLAFIDGILSVEEKNNDLQVFDEVMLKSKEALIFIEHEPGKKPNFYKQETNVLLMFDRLYAVINTLGDLAIEKTILCSEKNFHYYLVNFIEKAQASLYFSQDKHEAFLKEKNNVIEYIQNTSIEFEKKQQWIVSAFIQTISDVVDEMQSMHQASQGICLNVQKI